jgi:hypothetical protein
VGRVREFFDTLTNLLFKYRYNPHSRFKISTSEMYGSLGVYGNGPVFIGERKPKTSYRVPGIKYVSFPLRDTFVLTDDDGNVSHLFRRFFLNARMFKTKFPNEKMPPQIEQASKLGDKSENKYFEFVHYVAPRDEAVFDPQALDNRRFPYAAVYVCVEEKCIVGEESGYRSMPYKMPRTSTISGDPYGYSPAVQALASMGTASAIKKTIIKQGQRAVDPALLAADDMVMNGAVDLRPGAVNPGGVSRDGRALVQPVPMGDFRIGDALLQDERRDIEDSFFVTLFQILTETPEMTATEVMERVAEKAALLAPTMGRLQSEFGGPAIERELDVLDEIGVLDQVEVPPELVEAKGEYEIIYTSPMAQSMYAEEVSGFMRATEYAMGVAGATGDPSALDHFNFDAALPEISSYMAVPARWLNEAENIAEARQQRQQQQQQAQAMQNAAGLASAAKVATEAGQ